MTNEESNTAKKPSNMYETAENDENIILRAQKGDLQAFEMLLKQSETASYKAVFHLVGSEQDAEDIMQESALKAFRALPKFEGRANFSTWFYRIAVNTALEKLRRKRPKIAHSIDDPIFTQEGEMHSAVEDWSKNPEMTSLNSELAETLEKSIRDLPEDYREVIILKDRDGFSNKEVAEILGESVEAIKSRLHRGRLYIRGKLEKYFSQ